jgi:hypothetical protein
MEISYMTTHSSRSVKTGDGTGVVELVDYLVLLLPPGGVPPDGLITDGMAAQLVSQGTCRVVVMRSLECVHVPSTVTGQDV